MTVPTLWWSDTPITAGQISRAGSTTNANIPVTHISLPEAVLIADGVGGRLPTSVEWEWMAAGKEKRLYPWGWEEWTVEKAALTSTTAGPCPVRRFPGGATPTGVFDVAGNVWEWTTTTLPNLGAYIRGGSYASPPLYARTAFRNAAPIELRSRGIGFRIVRKP
ncbi:formylglycine-generating enzyme family protein [Hyphobacterium vulgare]